MRWRQGVGGDDEQLAGQYVCKQRDEPMHVCDSSSSSSRPPLNFVRLLLHPFSRSAGGAWQQWHLGAPQPITLIRTVRQRAVCIGGTWNWCLFHGYMVYGGGEGRGLVRGLVLRSLGFTCGGGEIIIVIIYTMP